MPVWYEYRDQDNNTLTPNEVEERINHVIQEERSKYKLVEVYQENYPQDFAVNKESIRVQTKATQDKLREELSMQRSKTPVGTVVVEEEGKTIIRYKPGF